MLRARKSIAHQEKIPGKNFASTNIKTLNSGSKSKKALH